MEGPGGGRAVKHASTTERFGECPGSSAVNSTSASTYSRGKLLAARLPAARASRLDATGIDSTRTAGWKVLLLRPYRPCIRWPQR